MSITFQKASIVFFVFSLIGISFYYSISIGIGVSLAVIVLAFAHRKGARKSTKEKHTDRRAGEQYDLNQNEKRGKRNKKYKKPPNPNKKKKE